MIRPVRVKGTRGVEQSLALRAPNYEDKGSVCTGIVLHISRMMCTEREERGLEKESTVGHARVVHYALKKENVLRPDPLREVTSDAACSEYLLLLLLLQASIVPYD